MEKHYFDWPVRVYYEDTDCARVVYYANYFRFMERARTEWLRALGWSQERLYSELGVVFVVAEAKAKYKKPARLDDELVVRSTVTACGRTSFDFHQEILRGVVGLYVGDVRCGTLDAHTFRPVAMPEPISEQLKKLLTH